MAPAAKTICAPLIAWARAALSKASIAVGRKPKRPSIAAAEAFAR